MITSFTRRFINKLSGASQTIASNIYSGAQRVVAAVVPERVKRRVSEFSSWLTSNVEPEQIPQILNQVFTNVEEHLPEEDIPRRAMPNFELRQEMSALREFATQHVIDGVSGWGPDDFLEVYRENITSFLRSHRNTKVKLTLLCEFTKETNDGTKKTESQFSSRHEIITRESDVNKQYDEMVKRIMENFDLFFTKRK